MGSTDVSVLESKLDNLEKEIQEKDETNEIIIKGIISILDEVDNIYKYVAESKNEELLCNFNSALKNIKKDLGEIGVEEIPTDGEIFDYKIHQCVETVEYPYGNHYEIVDTVKKGYRYKGSVVRPAYVIATK